MNIRPCRIREETSGPNLSCQSFVYDKVVPQHHGQFAQLRSQHGEPRTTRKGTVSIGAESLIGRYRAKNLPDRHDILRVGFSVGIFFKGTVAPCDSEKRPSSEA